MKRADIIGGILGLAFSALVFYLTASFPEDTIVSIGPAFFPRFIAAGLAVFCVIQIGSALSSCQMEAGTFSFKDHGIQRATTSVGATVIYCLFFEYLGFITCSIIYLVFLMLLLKDRKYVQIVLSSCAVTIVVFYIFKVLLNITLPAGTLYGF